MPLFWSNRDYEVLVERVNRELIDSIIDTYVTIYRISPDQTEVNLYGESAISTGKVFNMNIIVGTIPELGFTPLYLNNTNFIKEYNKRIIKLSTELNFTVCDLKGIEKYYVDNVHITHEGNIELAKKFKKTILGLQC